MYWCGGVQIIKIPVCILDSETQMASIASGVVDLRLEASKVILGLMSAIRRRPTHFSSEGVAKRARIATGDSDDGLR
jgi:hypothetical protein